MTLEQDWCIACHRLRLDCCPSVWCVCGGCTVYAPGHTSGGYRMRLSIFCPFPPYFLRQDLSHNLKLVVSSKLMYLQCPEIYPSWSLNTGVIGNYVYFLDFRWFLRFELRSYSSTFIYQTISSAPAFCLFFFVNKVLLECSKTHLFIAVFILQQQSWISL